MNKKKDLSILARAARTLTGARRVAAVLLAVMLTMTAQTAWAQNPASIGSINYNSTLSAYEIKSVANLNDLAVYVNGTGTYSNSVAETTAHNCSGLTFKQTADITYSHTTDWDDATSEENNYTAIGGSGHVFSGTFDGDGHTISGIRIYQGTNDYQGLFGILYGGEVKNVILADARITGDSYIGGVVGYNFNTVRNCHVLSTVTIHAIKEYSYSHGGIVGLNINGSGIVTGCTSAAAITSAAAGYGRQYGGIIGSNMGTVSDCLYLGTTLGGAIEVGAITGSTSEGTTVENCYFTSTSIAGKNDNGETLDNVASAVGNNNNGGTVTNCGLARTITLSNGATLGGAVTSHGKLTAYGNFALSYNDGTSTTIYSVSGNEITLSDAPEGYGVIYSVNSSAISGLTFTMPASNVTVSATFTVTTSYADAAGESHTVQAIPLTANSNNQSIMAGWYVVNSDVEFTSQVNVQGNGNVNLILADGKTMTVTTTVGGCIYGASSVTIYGQSNGTGTLTLNATSDNCSAIEVPNDVTINGGIINATGRKYGIYSANNKVTINGGTINATGQSDIAINGGNSVIINGGTVDATSNAGTGINGGISVTINGGTVTTTGSGSSGYGITGSSGVTVNGGKVIATGSSYGISAGNVYVYGGDFTATGGTQAGITTSQVTLGWTNPSDKVCISSFNCGNVTVVSEKTFYDGTGASHSGQLIGGSNAEYGYDLTALNTAIGGKTLRTFDYRAGTCGDPNVNGGANVTWLYNDASNTLTIAGTGAMADYEDEDDQPWEDYRDDILNVIIENGVMSIGKNAFYDCYEVTSFTIPASVTSIGENAFHYCTSATDVYCYADPSVLTWNEKNCDDFITDTNDANYPTKCHVYESNFTTFITKWTDNPDDDKNVNVEFVADLEDYIKNVTYAYDSNTHTLTISGTGPMDDYDFHNQPWAAYKNDIQKIIIENGITDIGKNAFYECQYAESVTIPASVRKIHKEAFSGCSFLETVSFAENSKLNIISDGAFDGCVKITSITIPANVKKIGEDAFRSCNSLTSITISANVRSIGKNAFRNCTSATDVYCYADPSVLTWNEKYCDDFITDTNDANYPTKCHVYESNFTTFITKWTDNPDDDKNVNVEFVGDLTDIAHATLWNADSDHDGTTAERAYIITTPEGLDLLAFEVNRGNEYEDTFFKLGNDITYSYAGLRATESNYTAIACSDDSKYFRGTFDGQGHTISGIRIYKGGNSVSDNYQGVFGQVGNKFTVKNLTLADTHITGSEEIGGIVGHNFNGIVENCTCLASVIISSNATDDCCDFGGIAGYMYNGSISNCTSLATIIIGDNANERSGFGGVAGYMYNGSIINCTSSATITIGDNAADCDLIGGIAGTMYIGSISNCISSATITIGDNVSNCQKFGGIVGNNDRGSLTGNLVLNANISGNSKLGAILGYNYNGTYSNNYYSGCTVGGAANATNVGYNGADITDNDGAVPATILSETQASMPALAEGTKTVFRREFKENVSSTVCLPFGIDATQAAAAGKFFTFVGVDKTNPNDWIVTMQETAGNNMVDGALTANTPYLFKPAATGPVLFHGTAAATATAGTTPTTGNIDGWVFRGTYERINWSTDPQTVYGFAAPGKADLAEGKFFRVKGGSNSYILPFRAYLDAANGGASARGSRTPAIQELPDVMTVRLISAEGTPTAIGTLDTRTGEVTFDSDTWYSLDGRRLSGKPTKSGLYINNGKKVVIK